MEKKPPRPMTPFDEWTVPNELHTLKLLLPYTPAASQPALGMLIKVIELQHTMDYFQQKKNFIHSQDFSSGFSSPLDILEEISPYLPPEEAGMINTFRNMMNIMDMVQMMQAFSDTNEGTSIDPNVSDEDPSATGFHHSENRSSFAGSKAPDGQDTSAQSGSSGSGFNPMNLVMGMLSPEQQEMFEMYQTMFSQTEDTMNASAELSDDTDFEPEKNVAPDDAALDAQDNNSFDDIAFETQNDQTYSYKERNEIDYE